ncbi:AlpA family phage regulatory protein [Bradyrhizobium sp. IC4061]|uniref:helix-turn-helix transcriptional regulator n=1 Tax=unclassified Bradyrhizobium TaxID=2631580 RepID=UPI002A274979|nr:AlpA family phage regulatory protein [Bradyrhizobium sp. IC4060]MCA1482952.1 AlpA family phage regulatory protein [Bradyrhizobium sp. IC4061]
MDEVLAVIPVSRTTLFRMERDRLFPPSYSISANRRAWYADEVLAWQKALPVNDRISRRTAKIEIGVANGVNSACCNATSGPRAVAKGRSRDAKSFHLQKAVKRKKVVLE